MGLGFCRRARQSRKSRVFTPNRPVLLAQGHPAACERAARRDRPSSTPKRCSLGAEGAHGGVQEEFWAEFPGVGGRGAAEWGFEWRGCCKAPPSVTPGRGRVRRPRRGERLRSFKDAPWGPIPFLINNLTNNPHAHTQGWGFPPLHPRGAHQTLGVGIPCQKHQEGVEKAPKSSHFALNFPPALGKMGSARPIPSLNWEVPCCCTGNRSEQARSGNRRPQD